MSYSESLRKVQENLGSEANVALNRLLYVIPATAAQIMAVLTPEEIVALDGYMQIIHTDINSNNASAELLNNINVATAMATPLYNKIFGLVYPS